MRLPIAWLALAALLAGATAPAWAQSTLRKPGDPLPALPGLGAQDPRQVVPVGEAPWSSLGRLQTEAGGRCTGTLIAPDTVLTAAHCLVSPRGGGFVHPNTVHFLMGYERGRATARRRAVGYRTGTGFEPGARGAPQEDWALVRLDQPIEGPLLPLFRRPVPPRAPLMLAGYQQDRPEVLLADTACRVLDAREGVLLHDCAATRGSSGAPLLVRAGQGWAIAGIASRAARDMALGQAVGVEMVLLAAREGPPPRQTGK